MTTRLRTHRSRRWHCILAALLGLIVTGCGPDAPSESSPGSPSQAELVAPPSPIAATTSRGSGTPATPDKGHAPERPVGSDDPRPERPDRVPRTATPTGSTASTETDAAGAGPWLPLLPGTSWQYMTEWDGGKQTVTFELLRSAALVDRSGVFPRLQCVVIRWKGVPGGHTDYFAIFRNDGYHVLVHFNSPGGGDERARQEWVRHYENVRELPWHSKSTHALRLMPLQPRLGAEWDFAIAGLGVPGRNTARLIAIHEMQDVLGKRTAVAEITYPGEGAAALFIGRGIGPTRLVNIPNGGFLRGMDSGGVRLKRVTLGVLQPASSSVACPFCGRETVYTAAELQGQDVVCKGCGHTFVR